MGTSTDFGVSGTGLIHSELGQFSIFYQVEIVGYGALYGAVYSDAGLVQFFQGTAAYSADDHSIHRIVAQGNQGLAMAVGVVEIVIAHRFDAVGFRIHDVEKIG
jgi:hypothetical protein